MPQDHVVTLLTSGNMLVIEPSTPAVRDAILPFLCFTSKKFLYGIERRKSGTNIRMEQHQCFTFDHKDRITTSLGFYKLITDKLKARKCKVVWKNLTPVVDPTLFEPRWDRLLDPNRKITFRYGQMEALVRIFAQIQTGLPCRIDCAPGFGKSYMLGLIAIGLPKARIHITTKRIPVLKGRILPELQRMMLDVGMIGGGLNQPGHRVQLISVDSMGHSDGKADILLGDEVQELAADRAAEMLGRYIDSVNIGFSATMDMRADNKSLREEAIFGPVVFKVGYQDAQANDMVVPIEVHWSEVDIGVDPCDGIDDAVERKRWGIWRNTVRNQTIASDARINLTAQTLIACETIEHALALKKELPEFTLVYAARDIEPYKIRYFRNAGIWPSGGLPQMTEERLQTLTRMFEIGKLRKVIVTTVWNVGVSMNHLNELIRADAGSSEITDTQLPGRVSRTNKGINKTVGRVRDYIDSWNVGFLMRSRAREKNYISHGWTQIKPQSAVMHSFMPRSRNAKL